MNINPYFEKFLQNSRSICKNCKVDTYSGYLQDTDYTYCSKCSGHTGFWSKQLEWDFYFLELAKTASIKSKDPSCKVGAVVVCPENKIVSLGYNGFAKGVLDNKENYLNREIKISKICHAEMNCCIFANKNLSNHTLYTFPFHPCHDCAKYIIQFGIKRVVAPKTPPDIELRWGKSLKQARENFEEAMVELTLLDF